MNNRRNYSKGRRVLKSVGQMRPFEQMVLVLLDLPSGYIFVESQATARDYQTGAWFDCCVKYLVSDRAQALVKLEGLGCRSIPDLFHALRELNRQIGSPLQLSRLDKQLSQTQETLTRIQAQVTQPGSTSQTRST